MTKKQRKELLKSAEAILDRNINYVYICTGMETPLKQIKEAKMFFPYEYYTDFSDRIVWWNSLTTDTMPSSKKNRQARLIAIAFMITMPKDML